MLTVVYVAQDTEIKSVPEPVGKPCPLGPTQLGRRGFLSLGGASGGVIVPVFASSLHAFAIWSSNLFSWEVLARFAISTHSAARSTYSSAFPIWGVLSVPLERADYGPISLLADIWSSHNG